MEAVKVKDQEKSTPVHRHHHHPDTSLPRDRTPPVPQVEQAIVPSFFENEALVAEILSKNTKPLLITDKLRCITRKPVTDPGLLTQESNKEERLSSHPAMPLPASVIAPLPVHGPVVSTVRNKAKKPHRVHHHPKSTKKLAEVRDRFRVAFEKQEGKKIIEAMAQMNKDIRHYENTLCVVQKRKVALLYHIKYLTKVLRKNRLQARHAASLGKSIGNLIKDTMHSQQAMARQAGIVNAGVRTRLVQMKDLLWEKLGMREYKPESVPEQPAPPGDEPRHPGHHKHHSHHTHRHNRHHHHQADGDPFHADGHPDLARMENVQCLLEPANFSSIVQKPGGLLAAQQYLINYLKQCSEVYDWMKSMKITYPTQLGFRRETIKNLPYFNVDTKTLFSGLQLVEDPLKVLHDQFPSQNFTFDVTEPTADIKALAAMFQTEPLSERQPEEPDVPSVTQKILHVAIPAKLQKTKHDSSLMSFEEYAAVHMPLVNLVVDAPTAVDSKPNNPQEDQNDGEVAVNLPSFEERYPIRSPKPESPVAGRTKTPELRTQSPHDLTSTSSRPDRTHASEIGRPKSPV